MQTGVAQPTDVVLEIVLILSRIFSVEQVLQVLHCCGLVGNLRHGAFDDGRQVFSRRLLEDLCEVLHSPPPIVAEFDVHRLSSRHVHSTRKTLAVPIGRTVSGLSREGHTSALGLSPFSYFRSRMRSLISSIDFFTRWSALLLQTPYPLLLQLL